MSEIFTRQFAHSFVAAAFTPLIISLSLWDRDERSPRNDGANSASNLDSMAFKEKEKI
jgi:hypothetical protein